MQVKHGTKQGIVEYYNERQGYGFCIVQNEDGTQTKFFIHRSQLLNAIPKTNSIVRFNPGEIPPGRTLALAEKVVVLKDKQSPADILAGRAPAAPEKESQS